MPEQKTLGELFVEGRQRLGTTTETPSLDCQVILAHLLGKPRAWILAHPEVVVTFSQQKDFERAIQELEAGLPLPYLLGHWEFFGLDFILSPAVLIPRPETEQLVSMGLAWLEEQLDQPLVLDVGTGSGCIAVSLAKNRPNIQVIASDISFAALQIARQNIHRYATTQQVSLLQANLLPSLTRKADLICANLPYIPSAKLAGLKVSRYEPWLALDGGEDGLRVIRRLLIQAKEALRKGGWLLLEIEAEQGQAGIELVQSILPRAETAVFQDLSGQDRILRIIQKEDF